jgi:RimJ/RimL family protein N-acetyltransferase
MSSQEKSIPDQAIEAFAKSFFKEASAYGFGRLDYLRFVNQLLEFSMHGHEGSTLSNRETVERNPNGLNGHTCLSHGQLPISGDRLKIIPLQNDRHRQLVKSWLPDKHGRHFLLSRGTSKDLDFDDLVDSDSNIFGLIALSDDTPIGSIAFLDYDPVHRKAELRKLIGEPIMRGKGLAKEATRLWIQHGVEALSLKKIYLNTLNTNIANIKLNEDLGFKFEGILRNEVFLDGKYHDVLRMGMWTE